MRRTLLAVTAACLLLTAACGPDTTPAAAPTSSSPSAAPTSASPSPSADYTAANKKVCGSIEKSIEKDFERLGLHLGKMMVYREAGNTSRANEAKAAAQQEMRTFADKLRTTTAASPDPDMQAAGQEAAENVEKTAADDAFFASLKSFKSEADFMKKFEPELTSWLIPLAAFCE